MRLQPVLMLALLAATGCRDGDSPFLIEGPEWGDSAALRLTFNPGDDRAPAWNQAGDSIYYVADGYPPLPIRSGIVLATSRSGGVAKPFLPELQFGVTQEPWLAAAARSTESIALIQLTEMESYSCGVVCPSIEEGQSIQGLDPRLQRARLRVRAIDAAAGADAYSLPIVFRGTEHDSTRHPFGVEFVHTHHAHPFQRNYNLNRDAFFRPSWSPDGERIVFSDGLYLYTWQPGAAEATRIAGTEDGVWPAWSPDGQWIAYTRLPRSTPLVITCFCFNDKGEIAQVFETTFYADTARTGTMVVMRPDGTDARDVGAGVAPTWSPDSRTLVAARAGSLYEIDAASGNAQIIPHTTNGFDPAISPDGNLLAFARENESGTHDIWVVRLR